MKQVSLPVALTELESICRFFLLQGFSVPGTLNSALDTANLENVDSKTDVDYGPGKKKRKISYAG